MCFHQLPNTLWPQEEVQGLRRQLTGLQSALHVAVEAKAIVESDMQALQVEAMGQVRTGCREKQPPPQQHTPTSQHAYINKMTTAHRLTAAQSGESGQVSGKPLRRRGHARWSCCPCSWPTRRALQRLSWMACEAGSAGLARSLLTQRLWRQRWHGCRQGWQSSRGRWKHGV